jgi:hypothetical protein
MKTLCFVVLFGLGAPALAQEAASTVQAAADVDELVVPGRRPENLRLEIERLERVVYERWNALNSNDEFDIHCLDSEPTGSNITQTRCAPNFVIWAESRAAKNTIDGERTAGSDRQTDYMLEMQQKSRQLTEEMQRVARQDEQFLRDLVRLDELRQLQANEREQRRKH